ncbi:MAG: hypothetical protein ACKOXB_07410 [Flavobacteriales bacterium]
MLIGDAGIHIEINLAVEVLASLLSIFFIYFVSKKYVNKGDTIEEGIFYGGLRLKIFAGIVLPLVYIFYYQGGDTISYYYDSIIMGKAFWKDPALYFDYLFNGMYNEDGDYVMWKNYFRVRQLDSPFFIFRADERAMFLVRIASVLIVITGGSFFASSILVSFFCYLGLWKVYKLFIEYYPVFKKQLSYTVLYIPSVVFWGSGILKDPLTLGGMCFLLISVHSFMKKRKLFSSAIISFLSGYLILAIKPYIFNAFIIGIGCWLLSFYLVKIKSVIFKALIFPFLLAMSVAVIFFSLDAFSGSTGQYSIDKVMSEAVTVQNDLKQEYYGGHRFDIGPFAPTLPSLLSKAPIAIATTLYRPFLWEADNPFILMSALESLIVAIFTAIAIFRIKIHRLQGILLRNPLLFFSFIFSLFFAFSVGLTTANFGALVRYKIPLMPFYLSMVYILSNYSKIPVNDQPKPAPKGIVT